MKKFFKILGVSILSVFIVLSAVFLPSMLKKNSNSMNSASAYVLAQNSFISSYIGQILPAQSNWSSSEPPINVSGSIGTRWLYSFKLDLTTFSNGYRINLGLNAFPNSQNTTYNFDTGNYAPGSYATVSFGSGSLETVSVAYAQRAIPLYNYSDSFTGYYTGVYIYLDRTNVSSSNYHNLDMQYVEIGNSTDYAYEFPFSSTFTNYNYFRYTDSNNCHLTIFIPLNNYDASDFYYSPNFFDYRIYYFNQSAQFDSNDFYKQGLQDGYNNGYSAGESSGYSSGYSAGETSGYSAGYNQGVENANEYTFIALIGAVFDAPINAFTSLFNFEILGFNILSFLTSLLTLCVILFILKLIFGGK